MAQASVKFSVDSKAVNDTVWLSPEDILVNQDDRGRFEPPSEEKILALVEDIKQRGQLHPVTVRKNSHGKPVLVQGYTRHEAVSRLKAEGIDIKIRATFKSLNVEDAYKICVAENMQRSELSPIDIAFNIRQFRERFGYSDTQIAKVFGKSGVWVGQRSQLLTLEKDIQSKVHKGDLSLGAALALASMPEEDRLKVLADAEAAVKAESQVLDPQVTAANIPVNSLPEGHIPSTPEGVEKAAAANEGTNTPEATVTEKITKAMKPHKDKKAKKGGRKVGTKLKGKVTEAVIRESARKQGVKVKAVSRTITEIREQLNFLQEKSPILAIFLEWVEGSMDNKTLETSILREENMRIEDLENENLED
jgi:ParB/RepB/Spo0J family partition protein